MSKDILLARIRKDRDALSRIERQEWLAQNQQHVGHWFKYRNCYSCSSTPRDYWWAYKKVLRVKDQHFDCFEFQTDKDGQHTIGDRPFSYLTDWLPCSNEEAQRAWQKLMKALRKVRP